MERAVVTLSGGQDSTTCLYYALRKYGSVEAVSFDYGQRHRVELGLAERAADRELVPFHVIPIESLAWLAGASLTNPWIENTRGGAPASGGWHAERGLPPSFVPGRNLLFLTLAAAYAIPRGVTTVVAGVCAQDAAGYPDCRADFVASMRATIALGMDCPEFEIDAPLLELSKAGTWRLAADLGVLERIVEDTHSCYEGDRSHRHAWGYGCGECGACVERARGYAEYTASA